MKALVWTDSGRNVRSIECGQKIDGVAIAGLDAGRSGCAKQPQMARRELRAASVLHQRG